MGRILGAFVLLAGVAHLVSAESADETTEVVLTEVAEFSIYASATSCKVKKASSTTWAPGECKAIDGYVATVGQVMMYYKADLSSCNVTDRTPKLRQYRDINCTDSTAVNLTTNVECGDYLSGSGGGDDPEVYEKYSLLCQAAMARGVKPFHLGLLFTVAAALSVL
mmetsp:Transcript_76588/g.247889  ORF Transcript_76588/g.247889 Transcript_76588/m.247889 type:complete len:166 (+) Transcript_76588:86-583(+)